MADIHNRLHYPVMTRAISHLIVLICLAAIAPCSIAAAPAVGRRERLKLSDTYDRCVTASGGATVGMYNCIDAEFQRQNGRLNQIYRMELGRLSSAQTAALRGSERKWVRDTKSRCGRAGDEIEGATGQPILVQQCYMNETAKRAGVLAAYKA